MYNGIISIFFSDVSQTNPKTWLKDLEKTKAKTLFEIFKILFTLKQHNLLSLATKMLSLAKTISFLKIKPVVCVLNYKLKNICIPVILLNKKRRRCGITEKQRICGIYLDTKLEHTHTKTHKKQKHSAFVAVLHLKYDYQ